MLLSGFSDGEIKKTLHLVKEQYFGINANKGKKPLSDFDWGFAGNAFSFINP